MYMLDLDAASPICKSSKSPTFTIAHPLVIRGIFLVRKIENRVRYQITPY